MLIVDAHEDIAMNVLHGGRDIRQSVAKIRRREDEIAAARGCALIDSPDLAMVALPEHRLGGVGLVFATLFTMPAALDTMTANAHEQLRYYHDLAAQDIGVRLITNQQELQQLTVDWSAARTPDDRPVGMVILMEGADALREPSDLPAWYAQGLRIVGPAWRGTRYAGGTGAPGPLTDLGRALLVEMERLGVTLDMSHMAEESFWQAIEQFHGTIIASHSNCRALVPTDRQLSDEMIRAIAERDGVIGTVMANSFLVAGWGKEDKDGNVNNSPVTLADVIRHIDHICQLTGSARHCAIGSDFDGGFGVESTPEAFDSVADLEKLASALAQAGYSEDDVTGIMGGNWLRLLARALPVA